MSLNLENIDLGGFGISQKEPEQVDKITPLKQVVDQPVQVKSNMSEALKINPDQHAKTLDLSKQSGVPAFAVENDPAAVESNLKLDNIDFTQMSKRNPNTAKYLTDFNNSVIAQDDIDVMQSIENLLTIDPTSLNRKVSEFGESVAEYGGDVSKSFEKGQLTVESSEIGLKRMYSALGADEVITDEQIQRQYEIEKKLQEPGAEDYGFFAGAPLAAAEQLPIMGEILTSGVKGAAIVGAAGAAAGLVAGPGAIATGIGGAKLGGRLGVGKAAFDLEAGLAFNEFSAFTDEAGNVLDPQIAGGAAFVVGGINAGLEFISLVALGRTVTPVMRAMIRSKVKQSLATETGREMIKRISARYATAIATETATEAVQEFVTTVGGELAKTIDEESFTEQDLSKALDNVFSEKTADRVTESAYKAAQASMLLASPGTIVSVVTDNNQRKKLSENEQLQIDQLNSDSSNSKLRGRGEHGKESFREFVEQADEENNTTVFIDGSQVSLYLQDKNLEEIEADQALSLLAKQSREANAIGVDVQVPVADFATDIAGTEHFTALRDSMTMSEESVSPFRQEQVSQENDNYVQSLMAEAKENASEYTEAQDIFNQAKSQLVDTGRLSSQEASVAAQIVPMWVTAKAKRDGKTVKQVYEESGLVIEGPLSGERERLEAVLLQKQSVEMSELSDLWNQYDDTGELTHLDLVDEVEAFVEDSENTDIAITLSKAIKVYRTEQREDFELGGRGDMDTAENEFNSVLESTLKKPEVFEQPLIEQEDADINTSQFKGWFGESQVVDENGNPQVVHHGGLGADDIEIFSDVFGGQTTGNNEHGAFHFTDDFDVAEDYGRQSFIRRFQDNPESLVDEGIIDEKKLEQIQEEGTEYETVDELAEERAETTAVYLNIETPYILDMEGERIDVEQIENLSAVFAASREGDFSNMPDEAFEILSELQKYDESDINNYRDEINERARENYSLELDEEIEEHQFEEATREILDEEGVEPETPAFDGIIIRNMIDDIGEASNKIADQFIVFDSNQIKSVKNSGAFSPYEENIFRQRDEKQEPRGYYDPENSLIRLTESSNLSTFLHEFAHFMYEMEVTGDTDMIQDINSWYKRNVDDVAKEANSYLGEKFDTLKQGSVDRQSVIDEYKKDSNVFWHSSPSGSLVGAVNGIHAGTHQAAKEAIDSRIGIPAEGDWDGSKKYGETLLAGKNRLKELDPRGFNQTGYNSGQDVPDENYYPSDRSHRAKYSGGDIVDFNSTPVISPVKISGKMKNNKSKPITDSGANSQMRRLIKKGEASHGYYYKNEVEDAGSISIVIPSREYIEELPIDNVTYLEQRDIPTAEEGSITADDVNAFLDNKTTGDTAKDEAVRRAVHEQFARGFETYLMEGKAPSIELRNAFRTFARWLAQVYANIRGDLNVTLDDEAREFFDRLIATEEQIAAAQARMRVEPLFTDAVLLGLTEEEYKEQEKRREMEGIDPDLSESQLKFALNKLNITEEEYKKYQKKQAEATDKQSETLRDKLIKQLTRKTEAWWKEEKQDLIDEEIKDLKTTQVYITREKLKAAKPVEGDVGIKLDHATVKEMVGEKKTDKRGRTSEVIPPKLIGMTAKGQKGIHPDEAAALMGYESGSEMLHDLVTAPPIGDVAAANAELRMVQRHGDILNDGTIEKEADEAVQDEVRADLMLRELKILSRNTSVPAIDRQAIKDAAVTRIGKLSFRQIFPAKYRKAEIKAAQEAARMLAEGNKEGAAQAKIRQVVNFYLGSEATKAKNETMTIVDRMSRYNKKNVREAIQKAGNDYWEQLVNILIRFEFRKGATLKEVESLNLWMRERVENDGDGVILSNEVLNESYVTHWKNVPYSQLQGINDSVKNLEHVARYSNKINLLQEVVDFNTLVTQWVDSMNESAEDRFVAKRTDIVEGRNHARWAMAQMTKIPYMASWLDGGERVGISHNTLVQPFTDAYNEEIKMWKEAATPVMEAINARTKADKKRHNRKFFIPAIDDNLYGHQIIAVALNTGNAGNLRKMLLGEGWADPENDAEITFGNIKLQAVLQHMTKSDWEFVQLTWDQMDTLYQPLAEVHRKTTGLVPPKVEATPITFPSRGIETDGMVLRGGYYPVKYDPARSERAKENEDRMNSEVDSMFSGGASIQASVNAGATNERTGFYDPIRLSMDVIQSHFQETIHYITHHDAVRQVNK